MLPVNLQHSRVISGDEQCAIAVPRAAAPFCNAEIKLSRSSHAIASHTDVMSASEARALVPGTTQDVAAYLSNRRSPKDRQLSVHDSSFPTADPDYPLEENFSWLRVEDDATSIHSSSNSDDPYDDSDSAVSSDNIEVQHEVGVHHNPDRMPPAWCDEAERETPEPEKPMNGEVTKWKYELSTYIVTVGTLSSVQAHETLLGAESSSHAQSAIYQGVQQDLCHISDILSGFVWGLEFSRGMVKGEPLYRKKVLEYQEVDQENLCKLIDERRVQAIFITGQALPDWMMRSIYNDEMLYFKKFQVIVAAAEWSDWKSWESYKADEASYKNYQAVMTKGSSFW
ncbi:hypothetical protein B0J12DRAFT_702431 [Macrophomina phaseolina]|uniref:Uncharacterized protein n=1 Tax=Macrophomina phaseolina TaxID=35725 RepID=A0ABQ8G1X3_9PEZI|nr:hypothetical protein B0J12DRAFT_702431 [Macrophomina phaseolina]